MSNHVEGEMAEVLRRRVVEGRCDAVRSFISSVGLAIDVGVVAASPTRFGRVRQLQYACWSYRRREGVPRDHLIQLIDDTLGNNIWEDAGPCPLFGRDGCTVIVDPRNESPAYIPLTLRARERRAALLGAFASACSLLDAWPGWRGLSDHIGQVIVLDTIPVDARSMHSYTLSMMPCVLYMNAIDDPVRYAETIVHETAHIQLNEILVDPSSLPTEPTWRSPWKSARRPAFGILHATYAFSSVLRALIFLERSGLVDEENLRPLRSRVMQEAHRLDEARDSYRQALLVVKDEVLCDYLATYLEDTMRLVAEYRGAFLR